MLNVRLREIEKRLFREAAKAEKRRLSDWIRLAGLERAQGLAVQEQFENKALSELVAQVEDQVVR